MDMQAIENYVKEHDKFEMSDLQEQFSLTYSEADRALGELQKRGVIRYLNAFTYETVRDGEKNPEKTVYVPQNEEEAFFIRTLWECVKEQNVSPSFIQRRMSCGYAKASRAIEWMEENGFVGPYPARTVKISVEEFKENFGEPKPKQESDEIAEIRRRLEEYHRNIPEPKGPIFQDDDEDDEDEDDDDEDYTFMGIEDVTDGEGNYGWDVHFGVLLVTNLQSDLKFDREENKFVYVFQGEPIFEIKTVGNGAFFIISDGGRTLQQKKLTEQRVKNMLKNYPTVRLDEGEIATTVVDSHDILMSLLTLYSAIDAVKRMK